MYCEADCTFLRPLHIIYAPENPILRIKKMEELAEAGKQNMARGELGGKS